MDSGCGFGVLWRGTCEDQNAPKTDDLKILLEIFREQVTDMLARFQGFYGTPRMHPFLKLL